jgi:ribosomal protein S18
MLTHAKLAKFVAYPVDMYRSLLPLLLILFSMNTIAQEKVYYDKFFKTVSRTKTDYYRIFQDTDSAIMVTEMCRDTIMSKGAIYPGEHQSLVNDFVHFVKSNGNLYQFKNEFTMMRCEIDFYKNVRLSRKMVSHSGKIFHAQIWSEEGLPLLVHGSGKNIREEKASICYEFYGDSVLTEMFEVRQMQRDTLYYTYDKMAEPPQGYPQFTQDLVAIMKYPGFARLVGKQGMVYVQFIIDKNGNLTEFTPLTKEGFNLEKKAIDKLSKMPAWNPAVFRNKPVKMKFVIPIKYKLT